MTKHMLDEKASISVRIAEKIGREPYNTFVESRLHKYSCFSVQIKLFYNIFVSSFAQILSIKKQAQFWISILSHLSAS